MGPLLGRERYYYGSRPAPELNEERGINHKDVCSCFFVVLSLLLLVGLAVVFAVKNEKKLRERETL